ncbi:hypothetical protein HYH03_007836 [Edaphochlamys debaryana]|uniref:Uncharacterized protein n=1 Tax=Edaphochlamys debaryana TaxID=47281 RepID=A0A836BZY9_9CHLO|nr:hypothetical protein HYH03_007836 [Edaphochlamys debaryana]|eukprot:KAG2493899.1 hypothetical protein HYH03_007836 [Edaphochlamys debaryana]
MSALLVACLATIVCVHGARPVLLEDVVADRFEAESLLHTDNDINDLQHQKAIEEVINSLINFSHDALQRRVALGVYGAYPPAYPAPGYPSPPSNPPPRWPDGVIIQNPPPPSPPAGASPPPSPMPSPPATPQPSPPTPPTAPAPPSPKPSRPPRPPAPPPFDGTWLSYEDMPGMGSYTEGLETYADRNETGLDVAWAWDRDFREARDPRNPLNLVFWTKRITCPPNNRCRACPRAWHVEANKTVLPIYFQEPQQIGKISIKQIRNPGLLTIQLLPWPAVPIPGLPTLAPSDEIGITVFQQLIDDSQCGQTINITLPLNISGLDTPIRPGFNQTVLPPKARRTAIGGILISMKPQTTLNSGIPVGERRTVVEGVRFEGRVLYPRRPRRYDDYKTGSNASW